MMTFSLVVILFLDIELSLFKDKSISLDVKFFPNLLVVRHALLGTVSDILWQ